MSMAAQKTESMIEVSAVLPADVPLVWNYIVKYLDKSCRRSGGRHTVETIYRQLVDQECGLWIAYDKNDNEIKGCFVTNFALYPTGLKMLNILQLAGKNMEDWVEISRPILTRWAKQTGCHGMEATGRKGFEHWSSKKDKSWKSNHVHFEIRFEENK
tara:strand:+ start:104 stop:574 length:471 start_codon:yes stop_codon:yes gene_type:complete